MLYGRYVHVTFYILELLHAVYYGTLCCIADILYAAEILLIKFYSLIFYHFGLYNYALSRIGLLKKSLCTCGNIIKSHGIHY